MSGKSVLCWLYLVVHISVLLLYDLLDVVYPNALQSSAAVSAIVDDDEDCR